MHRPTIGVTFSPYAKPEEKRPYIDAIEACGGEVRVLFENPPRPFAKRQLHGLGGIMLTGGGDIHPFFYRDEDRGRGQFMSRERDVYELALTRHALRHNVPILAICRGIQTLVVAAGGSLYQHLLTEFEHPSRLLPPHTREKTRNDDRHPVRMAKDSRLSRIFGGAVEIETNSRHHQACKDVPASLSVVARAADGVIEGVESPTHTFALGVQWHPEYPPLLRRMRPLFDAFADAADSEHLR